MNKKISKTILVTMVGAMIVTSIFIGYSNKENYEMKDIGGNRKVLEDVNLIYQQNKGFYRTSEVKISKDDTKTYNFTKGSTRGLPLSSYYKENRDIFSYAQNKENIYKDDNNIGYVQITSIYNDYDNNNPDIVAQVEDKNLKTNKIKTYQIPINYKYSEVENSDYRSIPLKYNNELYVMMIINEGRIEPLGENSDVYGSKESLVKIYKLNLETQTSELVISESLAQKDQLITAGDFSFTYKDKFYFIKDVCKKVNDKEYDKSFELVSYNLATKKFDYIDIPTNTKLENYYISKTYVENDEISFLSYDEVKNKKNKIEKLHLNLSIMNLENNKFVVENKEYNLELPDGDFNYYNINEIRDIDNKLYILVSAQNVNGTFESKLNINSNYIYVVDKNTKKTLYNGMLRGKSGSYIYPSIITNDEL